MGGDDETIVVLDDENTSMQNNEDLIDFPMINRVQIEAAGNEIDYANITLQQIERRLAIGQTIKDEAPAYALYCKYGSLKGFGIRMGRNKRSYDGTWIVGKFYFCACEEFPDQKASKNKVPEYKKTSSRCGCQVLLKIGRKKGEDEWKVTRFDMEHNHDMFHPQQTYLLKSTRDISEDQLVVLNSMKKSRIPTAKCIRYLEDLSGGREHVGIIPKDAYDAIRRSRKEQIENGDSFELVQHFIKKANNESNFYWNIEVDEDKHLTSFFFRDTRCRVDYESFGDVISFDTTYKTNKYDLICAPFVGINHHNENILFGIAFLSDETEISFEWLFRVFLESMGGKQPIVIFTDQCQSMMNVIENVFPCSQHRLCQWHIKKNASSHFGSLNFDSSFKSLWNKCVNSCESEQEFEMTWDAMMTKHTINGRHWFDKMYNLRRKWASVFSNHHFSAHLVATSRSEGTNTTLKKCTGNANSSLISCVLGYEEVQNNWRVKENEKDALCHHNKPGLFVEGNPILQQAAGVYTHAIFNLFQKEFRDTMNTILLSEFPCDGSSLRRFQVGCHGKGSDIRIVEYDLEKVKIKCTCRKFEMGGILCSHALKDMDFVKLYHIPDGYILSRWSKSAKNQLDYGSKITKSGIGHNGDLLSEVLFVFQTTKLWNDLASQCKFHEEPRGMLIECLTNVQEKVDAWFQNNKSGSSNDGSCGQTVEKNNSHKDKVLVYDPLFVKARGVTNKLKRHWESKKKKAKSRIQRSKMPPRITPREWSSETRTFEYSSQSAIDAQLSQGATNFHSSQYVQEALFVGNQFSGCSSSQDTVNALVAKDNGNELVSNCTDLI